MILMIFPRKIPVVGVYIQAPFKNAVELQKEKLHRKLGEGGPSQVSRPIS